MYIKVMLKSYPNKTHHLGIIVPLRQTSHSHDQILRSCRSLILAYIYQPATSAGANENAVSRMSRANKRSTSQAAKLAASSSGASRRRS